MTKNTFMVGTRFITNDNRLEMEVVGIESRVLRAANGQLQECNPMAIVKDLKTGRRFSHGLQALEHCDVTIID